MLLIQCKEVHPICQIFIQTFCLQARLQLRERERDIFISLWLQVCVTGPRHHLASSLLTKRRGHDKKGIFTWVTSMVV